jgi:hypothetical protein
MKPERNNAVEPQIPSVEFATERWSPVSQPQRRLRD